MADNTTLDAGSGGDTIRTEDRTTFKTPVSLIDVGGTSSEALIGDAGVAMPVKGLGTAGTANDAVLTVQGIASMTPIQVADNGSSLTVDGTVATTQSGTWNVGTVTAVTDITNTVTVDNAGTFAVQVDGAALTALQLIDDAVYTDGTGTPSKGLAVMGSDGTNPQLIVTDSTGHLQIDVLSSALPSGAATAANQSTANTALAAIETATEAIQTAVEGTLTVTATDLDVRDLSSASDSVAAVQSGTWNIGTVTTVTTVSAVTAITNALPAGDNNIGNVDVASIAAGDNNIGNVDAIQSGTWTVQPGNTANTTPWLVTDTAATSGGLSMSKTISAASTNSTVVKASAGQVYAIQASNINADARYLKLYNKASAPTVGTDTPVKTLVIPGNTAGAGFVINFDKGLAFSAGISFAITSGIADSDTGAVSASEHAVNIDYK